jgi:thermostable 8-oxoguanine DNA glycosylase
MGWKMGEETEQKTDELTSAEQKFVKEKLYKIVSILEADLEAMRLKYPSSKKLPIEIPVICYKLDEIRELLENSEYLYYAQHREKIIELVEECRYISKQMKVFNILAIYRKLLKEVEKIDGDDNGH